MREQPPHPQRRRLLQGLACAPAWGGGSAWAAPAPRVPILAFHRFAATVRDGMTVRTTTFEAQLAVLAARACQVMPLERWVAWRLALGRGEAASLPARAVVLTADDGHRSQFEIMAPRLRERGWPVTLFVYPSALSNAPYAMTWAQLRELADDPQFSVQSHTYWHPDLLREQAHDAAAAERFVRGQLLRSRLVLEQQLGHPVRLLAWPFGQSDAALARQAAEAGYQAAFSLGNRAATGADSLYAVPRHLMVDALGPRELAARLDAAFGAAP